MRVTAGLGTVVVQQEQRSLMNEAWRQIENIKKINEELRLAQLARALAERLHIRHLATAGAAEVMQVTAAVHARVKASPVTIAALVGRSPIPPGVLQGQLRRVTRPAGPVLRRIARIALPITGRLSAAPAAGTPASVASRLVDRMNTGELRAAAPPVTPAELPTTAGLASKLAPDVQRPFDEVRTLPRWLVVLVLLVVLFALVLLGPWAVLVAVVVGVAVALLAPDAARAFLAALRDNLTGVRAPVESVAERLTALGKEQLTSDLVATALPNPAFQLQVEPPLGSGPLSDTRPPIGTTTDSADARLFRTAAADLFGELSVAPAPVAPRISVDVPAIGTTLVTALTPRLTIVAALKDRLVFSPDLPWQPADPIEPVMAYPTFDRPMYEPLRELGQDWLLPGLDQIPANTVTLMLANQRFIEAYMTGLNHEMSRELRWNEYLTDLRGSYFRQFWDVRGAEPSPGQPLNPEQLRDIREMHTWPKTSELGQNSPRPPVPPGEERLVLVVRGDLVRRYPNTEVYALRAEPGDGPKRNLGDARQNPIFRGTLRPDLFFFGFNLTPGSAIGALDPTDPQADQGWFFVLEEQPAEPRFGLDVASTFGGSVDDWNNLSWGNLAASANDLGQLRHINLDAQLPDSRPITDTGEPVWHADSGLGRVGSRSADLASITLQRPVRIAIHASDMLPRPG